VESSSEEDSSDDPDDSDDSESSDDSDDSGDSDSGDSSEEETELAPPAPAARRKRAADLTERAPTMKRRSSRVTPGVAQLVATGANGSESTRVEEASSARQDVDAT